MFDPSTRQKSKVRGQIITAPRNEADARGRGGGLCDVGVCSRIVLDMVAQGAGGATPISVAKNVQREQLSTEKGKTLLGLSSGQGQ